MANFKIMRNGLNTEIVGDPHIGQSSEDVTVAVTDDGTYTGYEKKLYYSYGYRNQIYRAIADENASNEFVIPMTAFLEPGIVKLSLELSKGTNKPTCNAVFIIVTEGAKSVAASDILPDEKSWQSYIQSYIKSNAEEFKGDTGPQGPRGEKGDTGSVENLEVGGRNLLIGTNNGENNWDFGSSDGYIIKSSKIFTELENANGVRFDIKEKPTGWSFLSYKNDNIKNIIGQSPGKNFTISFDFKSDISSSANVLIANTNGTGAMVNFSEINFNANEWKHVELTSTVINTTVENQIIYMYTETLLKNATYVEIANLKLERGEIATDWAPSLEDYENKFNNIIARLEALESK